MKIIKQYPIIKINYYSGWSLRIRFRIIPRFEFGLWQTWYIPSYTHDKYFDIRWGYWLFSITYWRQLSEK